MRSSYILRTAAFLAVALSLSSCMTILLNMSGIKWPAKTFTTEETLRHGHLLGIPASHSFVLDSSLVAMVLGITDSVQKGEAVKRVSTPQVRYYNAQGELVSFIALAHHGTYPFKWSKGGRFKLYPPVGNAPIDSSSLDFNALVSHISPLQGELTSAEPCESVFVFWSRTMWRPSRQLIQTVKINLVQNNKTNVPVYYVNTDNAMAGELTADWERNTRK